MDDVNLIKGLNGETIKGTTCVPAGQGDFLGESEREGTLEVDLEEKKGFSYVLCIEICIVC